MYKHFCFHDHTASCVRPTNDNNGAYWPPHGKARVFTANAIAVINLDQFLNDVRTTEKVAVETKGWLQGRRIHWIDQDAFPTVMNPFVLDGESGRPLDGHTPDTPVGLIPVDVENFEFVCGETGVNVRIWDADAGEMRSNEAMLADIEAAPWPEEGLFPLKPPQTVALGLLLVALVGIGIGAYAYRRAS